MNKANPDNALDIDDTPTAEQLACPHCNEELTSVIRYASEHQVVQLDERGEVGEVGPLHKDGIEDVACGKCLGSLYESNVPAIKRLVEKLCRS